MGKIYTVADLKQALPQRYPMLMLDRAEKIDDTHYVAIKNLTMNELFFQGHFPNHPIMPGVLQVEAMKQLAELAVRSKLDPGHLMDVYIKVLEKVKFRRPNNPGDRMKVEIEVCSCDEHTAVINAKTSNNGGATCEAILTLASRPRLSPTALPDLYTEFDKSDATVMDVTKIMDLVPHRYPFLLIDNIAKADGDQVVAIKNVSANEEIFSHTATDYMVMPESLLCEIAAQSGCACVLSREENKGKIGYFMSIDRAEAFEPIFPGDQIVCSITLPPGKSKFGKGNGEILVNGKLAFKITLMFAIVDA